MANSVYGDVPAAANPFDNRRSPFFGVVSLPSIEMMSIARGFHCRPQRGAYWGGLVVGFVVSASAFAADVCKWRDEAGRPQFGDCHLVPAAQREKVDVRPASGTAPVQNMRASRPAAAAAPASVPTIGQWKSRFPPAGTPGPVGWTSTCERLAQRIIDLKPGTPFQLESNQIMQGCPGVAYHCEFSHEHPEINRCGPIAKAPGQALVSNDYVGYPEGVKRPTYRDLQAP